MKLIIIFLFFAFLGLLFPNYAHSQEELLTVTTSAKTYENGDTIVISGKVSAVLLDTPVVIQIFRGGTMLEVAQIDIARDGTFTHTIQAEGTIWQTSGTHVVRASYGPATTTETSFEFLIKQSIPETSEPFEVDAGNSGTFDIQYTIRGAVVKDMIVDLEIFGIRVEIETVDRGEISLDLPRDSIDALKPDGTDEIFIIFIDGVQVPYEEITDSNSRVITIDFEEGDSEIEIVGTFVIPEFGMISMLVFAIAGSSIFLLSRKKELFLRI